MKRTMKFENIIYNTTRGIFNVEDKLRIATIFLFCFKLSSKKFAELLYSENKETFLIDISNEFKDYKIDLTVNLKDKNIRDCFFLTLEKVKEIYDDNGYYKALYEDDPFAVVVDEVVNYDFDKIKFKKSNQK